MQRKAEILLKINDKLELEISATFYNCSEERQNLY